MSDKALFIGRISGLLWGLSDSQSAVVGILEGLFASSAGAIAVDVAESLHQNWLVSEVEHWHLWAGVALGLLYSRDEAFQGRVVRALHGTHTADGRACLMGMAHLVRLQVLGETASTYLQAIIRATDGMSDALHYALLRIGHVLAWVNVKLALAHLGEGQRDEEIVAIALYCLMKASDNEEAMHIARQSDLPIVVNLVGGLVGVATPSTESALQALSQRIVEDFWR